MAQSIGIVSQSMGTVTARDSSGNEREVSAGSEIFDGEVVSAKGGGASASVTFNNGCNMTLGADESALIDETVYKLEFFDSVEVAVDPRSVDEASEEVALEDEQSE